MIVTDGRGRPAHAPGLAAWLARVAPSWASGEVAVALVNDARIQALNSRYRHKNDATDVLSFPNVERRTSNSERRAQYPARRPHSAPRILGDIVIAVGVARRQAKAARHSYAAELRTLALHGLLHLLGYDHERPSDRARMERIERRLRVKGGLTAGLIERASRQP